MMTLGELADGMEFRTGSKLHGPCDCRLRRLGRYRWPGSEPGMFITVQLTHVGDCHPGLTIGTTWNSWTSEDTVYCDPLAAALEENFG